MGKALGSFLMAMIATKILHYLDYLQDTDYLATIVNSLSAAELCNIINALLQSEDTETVDSTCLFIRDLVLFGSQHPDCEQFVDDYSESAIVKTLEQLLFSPKSSPNAFNNLHCIRVTIATIC
jgi:hypothetical protein